MDATKKLFRKYLFSSILILLLFAVANIGLLLGFFLLAKNNSKDPSPIFPISQIAEQITVNNEWQVSANEDIKVLLKEKNTWAMVLDDSGIVIWEDSLPNHLPRQYTPSDIAKFTRWYLDDYPVLVQALPKGLLVIGPPPNSLTKLNYVTDTRITSVFIYGALLIIIFNLLLVLLLFWRNTRQVEKAVTPILQGIISLAKGKPVILPEKSGLFEINTALNQAGESILKKDRARGDWINGVSHDVRTPLSIMLGYAVDLETSQNLPQASREKAGIIRKQGEKLRRLIADLNLTSRLEYSMQPLNLEIIYPVELARQIISEFLNNGLEAKYQIDFEATSDLNFLTMQGDASLISRLLGNLIQNSIFHNPQGCHVIVSIHKIPKGFVYFIIDDGFGLSKIQLEAFNASVFSEMTYKSNGETAHGFGLLLANQIVKAHKGTITYENIPAKGLSIKIFLPI